MHRQFQAQSSPGVDVQPGHLPLRKRETQTVGAELSPRPPGSLRKDPVSERSRTSGPVGGGTAVQRPSGRRGDGVVDGRGRFVVRESMLGVAAVCVFLGGPFDMIVDEKNDSGPAIFGDVGEVSRRGSWERHWSGSEVRLKSSSDL